MFTNFLQLLSFWTKEIGHPCTKTTNKEIGHHWVVLYVWIPQCVKIFTPLNHNQSYMWI